MQTTKDFERLKMKRKQMNDEQLQIGIEEKRRNNGVKASGVTRYGFM